MMGRKGRPTMPGQEFGTGQGQMMRQEPQAPSDGMPVFYLYCRTSPGKPWYPVRELRMHSREDFDSYLKPQYASQI